MKLTKEKIDLKEKLSGYEIKPKIKYITINVNLEYRLPNDYMTEDQAIEWVENIELPGAYQEASFDYVRVTEKSYGEL